MGAGVSAGESNDDLIDNLIEAGYIRTPPIEKVFRAVDRGAYFLPDPQVNAYRDVAWKKGNFHISAPCIYSEVMERLCLAPGLSFLNLGSGTGYLSTIAGLILGTNGTNHGIELHEDVVQYAIKKVEEFKRHSGALDEFDFCEPKFIQGNCLCIANGSRLYDRVYCGAGCPQQFIKYLKSFIKIGGILIAPVNEELLEMKRLSETDWNENALLPVAFTNLVQPPENSQEIIHLLDPHPPTLQELCRFTIRNLLRKCVELDQPDIKKCKRSKFFRKNKTKKIKKSTSDDYYNYLLLALHRGKDKFLQTSQPRQRRDSEETSSTNTQSTDGETNNHQQERQHSDTDNSDADDDDEDNYSPIENRMMNLQEIFMDFINNSDEAQTTNNNNSTETPNKSTSGECDNIKEKTEEATTSRQSAEKCSGNDNNRSNNAATRRNKQRKMDYFDNDSNTSSSDDDGHDEENKKRQAKYEERRFNSKSRKIDWNYCTDSSDCDTEVVHNTNQMYESPYSIPMENKIRELPLPTILKDYLNYYREF